MTSFEPSSRHLFLGLVVAASGLAACTVSSTSGGDHNAGGSTGGATGGAHAAAGSSSEGGTEVSTGGSHEEAGSSSEGGAEVSTGGSSATAGSTSEGGTSHRGGNVGEGGSATSGAAGGVAGSAATEQGGAENTAGAGGSGESPCDDDPCQHGGTCTEDGAGYTCSCASGYAGPNCEHAVEDCTELEATYDENTTLEAGCYHASRNVGVGALLTLEAGVHIVFAQDVGMTIGSSGAIVAEGTVSDPVVLTGERQIPGYWHGLTLSGTHSFDNALRHVVIEFAGANADANLALVGNSVNPVRASIDNCVLRDGAEYGLSAGGYTEITSFTNNVLTANASGAATLDAEVVGDLDDSSSFSGNDNDQVVVVGGVSSDQTWPGIDVRYHVSANLSVGALLTLDPGVEIEFAQDVYMAVGSAGGLVAIGTEAAPILLTGAVEQPGYWIGLTLAGTNHPDNALEYVTIEYGGGHDSRANLVLDGNSVYSVSVAINHCTFGQSDACGVALSTYTTTDPTDLTSTNTFADNADGDVCGP